MLFKKQSIPASKTVTESVAVEKHRTVSSKISLSRECYLSLWIKLRLVLIAALTVFAVLSVSATLGFLVVYFTLSNQVVARELNKLLVGSPATFSNLAATFGLPARELSSRLSKKNLENLILSCVIALIVLVTILAVSVFLIEKVLVRNPYPKICAKYLKDLEGKHSSSKERDVVLFSIALSNTSVTFNYLLNSKKNTGQPVEEVDQPVPKVTLRGDYIGVARVIESKKWVIITAIFFSLFVISLVFFAYMVRFFPFGVLFVNKIALSLSSDKVYLKVMTQLVSEAMINVESKNYYDATHQKLYIAFGVFAFLFLVAGIVSLCFLAYRLRRAVSIDMLLFGDKGLKYLDKEGIELSCILNAEIASSVTHKDIAALQLESKQSLALSCKIGNALSQRCVMGVEQSDAEGPTGVALRAGEQVGREGGELQDFAHANIPDDLLTSKAVPSEEALSGDNMTQGNVHSNTNNVQNNTNVVELVIVASLSPAVL